MPYFFEVTEQEEEGNSLNIEVLQRATREVIERHESLRSKFRVDTETGEWYVVIESCSVNERPFEIEVIEFLHYLFY